jgi:hypothetical protein
MQVHTVRVSYTREKQPKDYEKAAPAIEFSAAIEEGEDHFKAGRQLMIDACSVVYNALGMTVPELVLQHLAQGEIPVGGSVTVETPKAAAAPKKEEPKTVDNTGDYVSDVPGGEDGAKEEEKAAEPKRRGRPPKKAPVSDVPEDVPGDEEKPAANVADVPEDVPAETPSESEEPVYTIEDLRHHLTALITGKALSVADVKETIAAYGASRTDDLSPEDALKVKVDLDNLVESRKKA